MPIYKLYDILISVGHPLMVNPLLIHDKLLLSKGVKKGGNHDKTTIISNNKSCPLGTWATLFSYC